jgi:general secretion pathway protein L
LGVSLADGHLSFICLRRDFGRHEIVAAARFALPPGADEEPAFLGEVAAFLLAARIPGGAPVTLGVPRADFFLRRFETPPVTARNLPELVAFEIERHLPGRREDFLTGWRTVGRGASGGQAILLGAARKSPLDRVAGLLRRADIPPASIQAEPFALAACAARAGAGSGDVLVLDLGPAQVGVDLLRDGRLENSRVVPVDDPRWRESLAPGAAAATPEAADAAQQLGAALAARLAAPLFREGFPGAKVPEIRLTGQGANRAHLIEKLQNELRVPVRAFSPWPLVRWAAPAPDLGHYAAALTLALAGPEGARGGVELSPERQEQLHRAPSRRLTYALAAALAGVLVALLAGHGVRQQRQLALADREIHALKLRMAEVEKVNRGVAEQRARLAYLDATVQGRARQADILRELTGLLPDSAYLTELTYKDRVVEISGMAASASQLLPVLEASPLFSGVEFSAPIVAQGAGLERFRIRLRLEAPRG